MNWIDNCIDDYYKWLKSKTVSRHDDYSGWSVISTPFIGAFNDPIEIFIKEQEDGKLLLSDDSRTLSNLDLVGVGVSRSQKRKEWLNSILLNYGVKLNNHELSVLTDLQHFPQSKHNLLCAIMDISDMELVAQNTVASLFKEDVRAYFDELELIYTPQFIMKGSTGIEFTFDFQLAGRNQETVVRSFNSLNKINVPNFLFTWQDIKPMRENVSGKTLNSLAIINDQFREIKPEYLAALEGKGARCLLWSERESDKSRGTLKQLVA